MMLTAAGAADPRGTRAGGSALWRLGFRPFYLLASIFAALAVPLWAMQYAGWIHAPRLGIVWHAHEMLFGFTMAVIAGFLFTAVRNWTAQATPTGMTLAAIAALWIAGRVLVLTPLPFTAAIVNTAFPIAVALGIGVPLVRAGNRRNYFFVALLGAIALAVLAVHLALAGIVALPAWVGTQMALDVFLFVIAVMAGRVVPMFTNNGVPGANAQRLPWLERTVLAATLAILFADIARVGVTAVLVVACFAHALRLALWKPWRAGKAPIVWSLHVAYAWIVIHLALRVSSGVDLASPALATHALTIGGIGGMTLAMMTRTARGHTGRPLRADGWDVASYALVFVAAVVRVFGPMLVPRHYLATIGLSATLWSLAFAIYAWRYAPALASQRMDGKPG